MELRSAILIPVRIYKSIDEIRNVATSPEFEMVKSMINDSIRENNASFGYINNGHFEYPVPPRGTETIDDIINWLERCWPKNPEGYFEYNIK